MWLRMLFISSLLVAGDSAELFDVTTIYEVGHLDRWDGPPKDYYEVTGRVHSRTNAIGLPLYGDMDGVSKLSNTKTYVTCNAAKVSCGWEMKDWRWNRINDTKIEEEKHYPIWTIIRTHNAVAYETRPPMYMYITRNGPRTIKYAEESIIIKMEKGPSNYYTTQISGYIFQRCRRKEHSIFDEEYNNVFSVQSLNESYLISCLTSTNTFEFTSGDELSFNVSEYGLQLYKIENNPVELFHIYGPFIDGQQNYLSFSGEGFDSFSPQIRIPVLTANSEDGELVSPLLSPESSRLCLVLVLHSPQDYKQDLLHIFAQDVFLSKHFLHTVKNAKAGLNVNHMDISLPRNVSSPIQLVIKKIGTSEVNIMYISSCDSEGDDANILAPTSISSNKIDEVKTYSSDLSVYTPDLPVSFDAERVENAEYACINGGVMTSAGCSCLPGFSGSQCEISCGENRYGQDCGGLCSHRIEQCEGLLLCTQFTGCHCAPGYKGPNCKQKCEQGTYGNDCNQLCGHCDRQCDIYTGRCYSCIPGFVPPYCQQEYVFLSSSLVTSSDDYGIIKVVFNPKNTSGYGTPELYQIQYKEKDSFLRSTKWIIHTTKVIPSDEDDSEEETIISEQIEGLNNGVLYEVRVLLLDSSLNKYDGHRVQYSEILTKCDIPETYDYNITHVSSTSSLQVNWFAYVNESEYWCPLQSYEVSWKSWKWHKYLTTEETFSLTELMSGLVLKFKVRAKTSGGFAPYSKILQASTNHDSSFPVNNLQMVSSQATSVDISWSPPIGSGGRQLPYKITYKCLIQPACSPGCTNATEGTVTQTDTSVTLGPLLPFAQYSITVTPEGGMGSTINVATTETAPTETPRLSQQRPVRTNTSLVVFWDPETVCSSFLQGYNYQLFQELETLKVLASGFTKESTISFYNLTASTEYIVRVFVVTLAGWNTDSYLEIHASTSATVPEAVENLTVYKRGRNMLGLRWAEPVASYGSLKSFQVTHTLGNDVTSRTIEPTRCVVWPNLYCYTVEGLKANRKYNVSVSARNSEVAEDGILAFVVGFTKETSPLAPEGLILTNITSTSVGLQWQYPNLTNGILRSFIVNVEETEKYDQDSCCQVYPLLETPVQGELYKYEVEVSGLHPASTYDISVSAKTVGLGPSQSLVVYTRPPHLPFNNLPSQDTLILDVYPFVQELSWVPQVQLQEVNNTHLYATLVKTHLLVAVFNETDPASITASPGVKDSKLNTLLQQMVSKPFYFLAEYNEEGTVSSSELGDLSSLSDIMDPMDSYQLIAVQVTEYNGVYNADLRYSSPIDI